MYMLIQTSVHLHVGTCKLSFQGEHERWADLLSFFGRQAAVLLDEAGNHVGHTHSAAAGSVEQHLGVLGLGALSLQSVDEAAQTQRYRWTVMYRRGKGPCACVDEAAQKWRYIG